MKILTIIPARGGSKGIPKKNIRPFAGHPLIAWSIGQSLRSKHINRTIVSTDDPEIRDVALRYGAEVPFLRPPEIAGDSATVESALLHTLEYLRQTEEYSPEIVVLLQPTSPIRQDGTINRAIEEFRTQECDSLLSVSAGHLFYWKNADDPIALYDHTARPIRQSIMERDKIYAETGSIYLFKASILLSQHNRLGGKIHLFQLSSVEGIDINTAEDFALAEMIAQQMKEKLPPPLVNPTIR